jgi:hypothetical protein
VWRLGPNAFGCSSSVGTAVISCEVVGVLVRGLLDAVVLAGEVEAPVAIEVAVGLERAEFQDGLGAGQAPAGAADVEAVADQMPTRPLDHLGGDRPAAFQAVW